MSNIRPGFGVEFIYHSDYIKDNVHVMRAVIFDVLDQKLILSQSSPRVLRSSLRKDIVVTYLEKKAQGYARYGISAKVTELIGQYEIGSGKRVPAIVIERRGDTNPFNFRRHYRLKLSSRSDLSLCIRGIKANLMDISVGGAMISASDRSLLQPHSRIRLCVGFDKMEYHLDSEVIRRWSPDAAAGNKEMQIASIKFLNACREFEHFLGKKIFTIERQLLAEGKML